MTQFTVHQTMQQTDLPQFSAHDLTKWTHSPTALCPKQMDTNLRIWRGLKQPRQAPEGDEWHTRPYILVHKRYKIISNCCYFQWYSNNYSSVHILRGFETKALVVSHFIHTHNETRCKNTVLPILLTWLAKREKSVANPCCWTRVCESTQERKTLTVVILKITLIKTK
jgi:hypothetical protein